MKCYEKVECPKCGSDEIGRSGRNENGVQRYRCKNEECEKKTFILKHVSQEYENITLKILSYKSKMLKVRTQLN